MVFSDSAWAGTNPGSWGSAVCSFVVAPWHSAFVRPSGANPRVYLR